MNTLDMTKTASSVYGCESKPSKQEFIKSVFHKLPLARGSCLFRDAGDMSGAEAFCVIHNKICIIADAGAGPALGAYGFSCKDFSKANNSPANKQVMIQQGLGTSGRTAHQLLEYLQVHLLPVIIIENVEDFCSKSHGQLEYFQSELKKFGYVSTALIMKTAQFYLPRDRSRAYVKLV